MLVWREPVVMNGRHALVLRPSDGGPDVLVRAITPVPMQRFSYLVGGSPTPVP